MPIVKFINEKKEIEVPEGANLRKEAMKAGVNLYNGMNGWGAGLNKVFNCWGFGVCGTCRVLIKKGMDNTNEMPFLERAKFKGLPLPDPASMAYIGHEDEMRLACCCEVKGDIEVETCPEFNLFGDNFYS